MGGVRKLKYRGLRPRKDVSLKRLVKTLPAVQETQVWSLVRENPLEKGMATHSSILDWRISWTEKSGGLQSMGLQSQTRLSDFHTSLKNVVSWSFILFSKLVSMTEGFSITLWISGWNWAPYSWLLYNVSENSVLSPRFDVYRIILRFCDRPGSGGEVGQIFPGSGLSWAVFPPIYWSVRSTESLDWPGFCSREFLFIYFLKDDQCFLTLLLSPR